MFSHVFLYKLKVWENIIQSNRLKLVEITFLINLIMHETVIKC